MDDEEFCDAIGITLEKFNEIAIQAHDLAGDWKSVSALMSAVCTNHIESMVAGMILGRMMQQQLCEECGECVDPRLN